MGQSHPSITSDLIRFIRSQPVFFVASAPLSPEGHVNVSPKGLDSFQILGPRTVAYLDLTGSGNETSAHLEENGRITVMFCSFDATPRILRLYGRGRVLLAGDEGWAELLPLFPSRPGARQIVVIEVDHVQTSCGFGVPVMELVGQRDNLLRWSERKGEVGLARYRQEKNSRSLDGLPSSLGLRGRP